MKTSFFYSSFLIPLFFIFCPSIFIKSSENEIQIEHQLNKEAFEELMSVSRKQTQEIGWCCQQIIQTLCNNKEQYQIKNKQEVIHTLKGIQELTQYIDLEIYSKNTHSALTSAIIFNNALIHFLSNGIDSKFQDFGKETYKLTLEKVAKKSTHDISNEIIVTVIQKNDQDLKNLLYKIGTTGLTWYNLLHRTMKNYNVYDITKKIIPVGIGLFILANIACKTNTNLPKNVNDYSWLQYWTTRLVGSAPIKTIEHDEENYFKTYSLIYKTISDQGAILQTDYPQTVFQKINTTANDFLSSGLISVTPLLGINFSSVANYCFGDSWSWTKNKYHENINGLDKFLQGELPNKNLTQDGQEKVYFQDLIGCSELEELAEQLANFVEHPEFFERSKTESHRGILLHGPPQTGKSNFAKALRTLIQDRVGDSKKIGFIDGKSLIDRHISIEDIFDYAAYMSPCILFLDEIDLIGTNREKDAQNTGKLLTCMQGIDISSKQIIVIGATNRIEQLDKALLVDGRFGKQIFIDYPIYQHRKEFLESELAKRAITLEEDFIDHMAQETNGCSYNNLKRIITEAIIISVNERRLVCQNDFEKTLDIEIRKINIGSRKKSSQEEKEIIASYQAGKAIIRHLLSTDRQIIKVTIEDVALTIKCKKTGYAFSFGEDSSPENEKLASEKNEVKIKFGEVFTKSKGHNKALISDEEVKKECLVLLAGNIAQQILLKQTYSQLNKHDRADAMQYLHEAIAKGEKVDDKIRAQALEIKQAYEKEIAEILENNHELLTKVFESLTENITIDRYQWEELIS